jgi:hypothetical protein
MAVLPLSERPEKSDIIPTEAKDDDLQTMNEF